MIYKISPLLDELRRAKVLGRANDSFSFDLIWQCKDGCLLHNAGQNGVSNWVLVERTGIQYYKVKVLRSQFEFKYILKAHFRNSPLTTDYIKKLL